MQWISVIILDNLDYELVWSFRRLRRSPSWETWRWLPPIMEPENGRSSLYQPPLQLWTVTLWPQIRAHALTWKLTQGQLLSGGGGGYGRDRTRGFLVPQSRCFVKHPVPLQGSSSHTRLPRGSRQCFQTFNLRSGSAVPSKFLSTPSYDLRKPLFHFKIGSCCLQSRVLTDMCLMSHSLGYRFTRAHLRWKFLLLFIEYSHCLAYSVTPCLVNNFFGF